MDPRPLSEWLLAGLVIVYSLNFGPMFFESFTSDRTWASNPPESFHMFRGPYGQKTTHYWRVVGPLATLTFVLSVVLNWHVPGRTMWLVAAFVGYIAVQAATMAYFVPEQETLITNSSSLSREAMRSRTARWISLNYFRNAAAILAFVLLLLAILTPRIS